MKTKNKTRSQYRLGKTYEELYGKERAIIIARKISNSNIGRKNKKGSISVKKHWARLENKQKLLNRNKKISKSLMGYKQTKEHRINNSLGHMGQKSWNKGLLGYGKGHKGAHKGKTYDEIYGEDKALQIKKKLSELMTPERREELSRRMKLLTGELSPKWLGGKSFEPYDIRFNNQFKKSIRKRDNQICMLCGIHREKLKRALDVHHVNYDKQLSVQENCISLCQSCHTRTGANRKHWINFFQSLLSEKYGYKYSSNGEVIKNYDIQNMGEITN